MPSSHPQPSLSEARGWLPSLPLSRLPCTVLRILLKGLPIHLNARARHLGTTLDNFLSLSLQSNLSLSPVCFLNLLGEAVCWLLPAPRPLCTISGHQLALLGDCCRWLTAPTAPLTLRIFPRRLDHNTFLFRPSVSSLVSQPLAHLLQPGFPECAAPGLLHGLCFLSLRLLFLFSLMRLASCSRLSLTTLNRAAPPTLLFWIPASQWFPPSFIPQFLFLCLFVYLFYESL